MKISIPVVATEQMPIEQLRLNELNSRDYSIDEGIDGLGQQLRAGQVQALTVFPSEVADDYTVLDGHRRLLAARRVGISYLQVIILDKAPTREEQLAFIHSAGSTGRALRHSELATLVQGALDTLDEASVAARFGVPLAEVRARRVLAGASGEIQGRVDAGQVDVLDLLKMQAAVAEFAGTKYAEQIEAYVAVEPQYGRFDVDAKIARLRHERDLPEKLEALQAELKEHKAKVVPDAMRYGNALSTSYGGHEAEKAMSVAEHVVAGHQYYLHTSDASVTWYWKRPKAAEVDPNEGLSEEEVALRVAEQAAEDEARTLHEIGTDRREQWIGEQFEAKDPLAPLQARVSLVRVLMHSVVRSYQTQGQSVLSVLTGLPNTGAGWEDAFESNLRKRSWAWLAAALELCTVHSYGMNMSRGFGLATPDSSEAKFNDLLKDFYRYEQFPEEVTVAEYHVAEAKKRCKECDERAETDAEGRCPECAQEALIRHCEECDQTMVGDDTNTVCAACLADGDED